MGNTMSPLRYHLLYLDERVALDVEVEVDNVLKATRRHLDLIHDAKLEVVLEDLLVVLARLSVPFD